MKFRYDDLLRKGWVLAPDDGGGSSSAGAAADAEVPPAATDADSSSSAGATADAAGAAGGGAGGAGATASLSMSQEDFDAAISRASARALADARAETERSQREVQAREAENRRRQATAGNTQYEAMEAMDLRADMLEEALLLHPDMPAEARQQLKDDLRSFKSIEQVRAAKDSGLHVKLADAAAGASIRSGKYTPKTVAAVTREPAVSEPVVGKVPEAYRREMEAEFASMGLKLSEAELREAYAADSSGRF